MKFRRPFQFATKKFQNAQFEFLCYKKNKGLLYIFIKRKPLKVFIHELV